MEIEKDEINTAIGELLSNEKYEKYKFLPEGLVGEICRDFVEEIEKIDKY